MSADYFADENGEFELVISGSGLEPNQPIYLEIDIDSPESLEVYVEKGS